MKLLLTSAGITNDTIADALFGLADKAPEELKVAFIPTAATVEEGNKTEWFFRQYEDLRRIGIQWIDMVDFSAAGVPWQSRLAECDVLYLTGGNTFHLLDQIHKTGFEAYLGEALKTKVYVGGSASAIVMTPSIEIAAKPGGDPNLPGLTDFTGLNFVDFEIAPHRTSENMEVLASYAKERLHPVYGLDDQSAIRVVDSKVEVVSEGAWRKFGID